MDKQELKVAMETGYRAGDLLRDVLAELAENYTCPDAYGFEGPETFPDCGKCIYCIAKQIREDIKNDSD